MLVQRIQRYTALFLLGFCLTLPAAAADKLTLAVHPYLTAKELTKRFGPLTKYLSEKLGKPVELSVAKDYVEHIQRVGKDEVDIAYLGPASYVEMVAEHGAKPVLARLEVKGKPTFRGAIVHASTSKMTKLEDLQGKRFAFGSPHSTMSHLVPRYMLHEAGVTKDKLADLKFLGSHDNVALSVLTGESDAGAVKEAVYHKNMERGLKLLAWTPEISEHIFVASTKLPAEETEAVRKAMLELRDEKDVKAVLVPIKKTLSGLAPATDADYENLRSILNSLKAQGIPE